MTISKERRQINREYPIFNNFPFNSEFDMEILDRPDFAMMDTMTNQVVMMTESPNTLNFTYLNSPMKVSVSISENELMWIGMAAGGIKKMDTIAKKLDRAIKSKNLIVKRDVSIEADIWLNGLTDGKNMLSKAIFDDALNSIAGPIDVPDAIMLVTHINKLYSKKGFLRLTKKEASTIMTFIQFRLIYVKLILGIVIASKVTL